MISSTLFCDHCGGGNQAQATYCRFCGRVLHAGRSALYHTETGYLLLGVLLKQRYRIMAALGQGGMGAVYQAEDTQLGNRQVALKEMGQSGLSPQERHTAAEAFRQEAVMLARLNHPGLPSIFDHFEENGRWYLVMSFIEGETLDAYLSRSHGGRLPVGEAAQIGMSLCTVLSYLHNQHPPIIFRDLKPANIMRTPDGNLYLIDFGIARHFKPGQTKDTAYYGSMGYAPPEQYGKAQTTPRSDIYSLGVILHQLLSGHDPATTPFRFPTLSALVANAPVELTVLVGQMLDLDDEKRPANVLQIKQELQALLFSAYSTMPAQPAMQNLPPLKSVVSSPAPTRPPTVTPPTMKPLIAKSPTVPPAPPVLTKEQWLESGDNHARTRHYLDALMAYDRALRLDPNLAEAYGHKGQVLYELRRFEDALSACEKALRLNPVDFAIIECKADVLVALGRHEDAIDVYEQAIHLAPTDARGYYGKAAALEALGQRNEALVVLDRAIELAPNDTRGYYSKADILEALDRREAALAVLDQAIRLAPNDLHGYRTKALLLEALERNEEALSAREQIIRLDPTDAYNYYYKSSLLEKLARLEEALATYEQAIQLDPNDDFMYQRKAALLHKLNRLPEALSAYEQAIHLRPEAASAHRGKGDILTRIGRQAEAQLAYEQADRYESI
ncbi:MAG TPA: serine/threonine-protein kinase [Ktedonobacteraceae bacterium]